MRKGLPGPAGHGGPDLDDLSHLFLASRARGSHEPGAPFCTGEALSSPCPRSRCRFKHTLPFTAHSVFARSLSGTHLSAPRTGIAQALRVGPCGPAPGRDPGFRKSAPETGKFGAAGPHGWRGPSPPRASGASVRAWARHHSSEMRGAPAARSCGTCHPPARRPGPKHQAVGIPGFRGQTEGLGRPGWRVHIPQARLEPGSWVHVAGREGESLPSCGGPRALGGERLSRGVRTERFPHTRPPPHPSSPCTLGRERREPESLRGGGFHFARWLGSQQRLVSRGQSVRKRHPARSPHTPRAHTLALPATSYRAPAIHVPELTLTPTPRSTPTPKQSSPCHAHPCAHPQRHTRSHPRPHTPPPPGTP